jgi:hypothetical protein
MSIAKILDGQPRPSASADGGADLVLEIAFLMTAVDGRLADEELPAYREVAAWVRGKVVSDDDFGGLLERFSGNIETGDIESRVRAIAPALPAELREVTFKIAMGLALVDQDASPEEDALVGILFEGLGLSEPRADALAAEVRSAFGG